LNIEAKLMDEVRLHRPEPGADTFIPKRYEFRIDGRRMIVPVEPELSIGRRKVDDPDDDVSIDLTRFGAGNLGVSRRHAQLLIESGDVFLLDLGSTNGTHLNGKALKASQPYRLRDGDEIELGQLRIVIRLLPA
jgi:pSer/pThr/pTyr-binding forkhead associated (FHA) protein